MEVPSYSFHGRVWLWPGPGGWHFIRLPKAPAQEIRKDFAGLARGWGSLPVKATIGKTTWATSIFPEAKSKTYLLPVKAAVRKAEKIETDATVDVRIEIKV